MFGSAISLLFGLGWEGWSGWVVGEIGSKTNLSTARDSLLELSLAMTLIDCFIFDGAVR